MSAPVADLATRINEGCACQFLDPARLAAELARDPALAELGAGLAQTHPHLFSASSVFLDPARFARMQQLVQTVERLVAEASWQARTLVDAPDTARRPEATRGGLLGFDFHIGGDGIQLIEINTNPGGALLNAALARAQRACCRDAETWLGGPLPALDDAILDVFLQEWRAARGTERPHRIAIVDEAPQSQYLYPEFLLYRALFRRAGIEAVIADPAELTWRAGRLWHAAGAIDFVYNRLTDFPLASSAAAALRAAHASDAVVLSPHPRAHALYANKRNLSLLCDPAFLAETSLSAQERALLLASVPSAEVVGAARADALWAARRDYFFKPLSGFGGRAAYRGDKLTRRVWETILGGDYLAQRLAPPSERLVPVAAEATRLKLDVRAYAYAGRILLLAARLYRGQTTNFRTPGGGFAPVWVLPVPG